MDTFAEIPQISPQERKDHEILFEIVKKALEKKQRQVLKDFKQKHKAYNQWLDQNKIQLFHVKQSLIRFILAGGFSMSVMLGTSLPGAMPQTPTPPPIVSPPAVVNQTPQTNGKVNGTVTQAPKALVVKPATESATPKPTVQAQSPLVLQEDATMQDLLKQYKTWPSEPVENQVADHVSKLTKVSAKANLDGHKMNKIYGFFGQEQHLYRYPGDTLEQHTKTDHERATFLKYGIAPGLGAWGYFASSKTQFTAQDEMREKYYIAAQTFLFPGFYSEKGFKDWLRFRKIIVYNPQNNRAVVAVIGDSGPATWTGKTYGGSPELMNHLQMVDGKQKSEAVVLFVEDPENKIPLGSIDTIPSGVL